MNTRNCLTRSKKKERLFYNFFIFILYKKFQCSYNLYTKITRGLLCIFLEFNILSHPDNKTIIYHYRSILKLSLETEVTIAKEKLYLESFVKIKSRLCVLSNFEHIEITLEQSRGTRAPSTSNQHPPRRSLEVS